MRHDNTAQLSYQIQNLITVAWLLLKYDKIRLPLYLNYHRKFACEMGHITLTGIVHAMVALNHRYLKMVAILPTTLSNISCLLQWRNNYRAGVSNHRRLDCLPNRLFRRRSKKIKNSMSLVFVRGIHRRPVAQKARNAENVSIWWCHHVKDAFYVY